MAKDDFTVEIEDNRIMFMTSYRNEFGEECKVANIISKERLIEIRDNINRALAELSNENGVLPIPDVSASAPNKEFKGTLKTYSGFTHSNRNILQIEVAGVENYIGNTLKVGDEVNIQHWR